MKNRKGFILLECLLSLLILSYTVGMLLQTLMIASYIDTEYEEELFYEE